MKHSSCALGWFSFFLFFFFFKADFLCWALKRKHNILLETELRNNLWIHDEMKCNECGATCVFGLSCETHEGWALHVHDVTLKNLSIDHSRVGNYLVTQRVDKKNPMELCNRWTERERETAFDYTSLSPPLLSDNKVTHATLQCTHRPPPPSTLTVVRRKLTLMTHSTHNLSYLPM